MAEENAILVNAYKASGSGSGSAIEPYIIDYKTFGTDSYVYNNKDILHEVYERADYCMNDTKLRQECFDYLNSIDEVGHALAGAYGISDADTLESLGTMTAVAASSTAMTAVAASSTAMTAVAASSTAMTAVAASSTAMTAVINSSTALSAVVNSSTAMTAVAASSTAMTAVAASSTAMTAVAASSTARNAVTSSSTAVSVLNALAKTKTIFKDSDLSITGYCWVYKGYAVNGGTEQLEGLYSGPATTTSSVQIGTGSEVTIEKFAYNLVSHKTNSGRNYRDCYVYTYKW